MGNYLFFYFTNAVFNISYLLSVDIIIRKTPLDPLIKKIISRLAW